MPVRVRAVKTLEDARKMIQRLAESINIEDLHAITDTVYHSSTATSGQMLKANANGLPVDASNTDTEVANAVTKTHDRQHAITATADHTSTATADQILKADANGLPADSSITDDGTSVTFSIGMKLPITRTVAATYAVLSSDVAIDADTDGNAIEVDLQAGAAGRLHLISNCGSSGNNLTIDPNGTETIDGGAAGDPITLVDGESVSIIFETTENWRVF